MKGIMPGELCYPRARFVVNHVSGSQRKDLLLIFSTYKYAMQACERIIAAKKSLLVRQLNPGLGAHSLLLPGYRWP